MSLAERVIKKIEGSEKYTFSLREVSPEVYQLHSYDVALPEIYVSFSFKIITRRGVTLYFQLKESKDEQAIENERFSKEERQIIEIVEQLEDYEYCRTILSRYGLETAKREVAIHRFPCSHKRLLDILEKMAPIREEEIHSMTPGEIELLPSDFECLRADHNKEAGYPFYPAESKLCWLRISNEVLMYQWKRSQEEIGRLQEEIVRLRDQLYEKDKDGKYLVVFEK